MLFAGVQDFAGESANLFLRLLLLRGVALAAAVGSDDEVLGFGFGGFGVRDVAVEFADVGAD